MRPLILSLCALAAAAAFVDSISLASAEEPGPTPAELRAAARDAKACPGMYANWIDSQTVECLKERP